MELEKGLATGRHDVLNACIRSLTFLGKENDRSDSDRMPHAHHLVLLALLAGF